MKDTKVITRFAPSPTGYLTVGNYRTALFSYLFARQNDGTFLLRIEDTDTERNEPEYEQDIYDSFEWLGLSHDGVSRQSENKEKHTAYIQQLIDSGHAYISEETEVKEGGRSSVIRFKNPGTQVTFTDMIRGDITFDTSDLRDFVIAKSLGEPLFHLAVVADDFDAGVTHIIRGEDHISNTPRQILIQQALGAPTPTYAHLPLLLAEDRSKLSKRNGALAIRDMRREGYLPETIINFLALLGWHPQDDREFFTIEELLKEFDISRIQKGGAVFNKTKLDWLNKEHLLRLPHDAQISYVQNAIGEHYDTERLSRATDSILERYETARDILQAHEEGEFSYLADAITYTPELLLWKKEPSAEKTRERINHAITLLEELPAFPTTDEVRDAVWAYAESEGKGEVLWPMRVALSGKERSPDPVSLVMILGTQESTKRLTAATRHLQEML